MIKNQADWGDFRKTLRKRWVENLQFRLVQEAGQTLHDAQAKLRTPPVQAALAAWFAEHGMSEHTALAWSSLRDIFPFTSTELKHFAASAKKAVKGYASGGKGKRHSALPKVDTERGFPKGTLVPPGTQGTPSEKKLPVLFPELAEAVRQTLLEEEKKRKATKDGGARGAKRNRSASESAGMEVDHAG
jgi:hypothetical protein